MKTVRFKQIVNACGPPRVYLSWIKPAKDQELLKLQKNNRVMTVHQVLRGAGKDFGTVGIFKGERSVQLLVFPKSLRRFEDRRVIGIDYALLAPEPNAPAEKKPPALPSPKPARAPLKPVLSEVMPSASTSEKLKSSPPVAAVKQQAPVKLITPKPALPASVTNELKTILHQLKAGHISVVRAELEALIASQSPRQKPR